MSTEAALQYGGAGATAGSMFGPPGAIIGGGLGLLGGALFGKKKKAPQYTPIDITAILAQIDKVYAEEESRVKGGLAEQLAGQQTATAESLAGRGIYSSPVSEYSFGANRTSNARALANALSEIAGNKATAKSNLMTSAATTNATNAYNAEVAKYEKQLESSNLLTGLLTTMGSAALSSSLKSPKKTPGVDDTGAADKRAALLAALNYGGYVPFK